jgi:hypothetical protein
VGVQFLARFLMKRCRVATITKDDHLLDRSSGTPLQIPMMRSDIKIVDRFDFG